MAGKRGPYQKYLRCDQSAPLTKIPRQTLWNRCNNSTNNELFSTRGNSNSHRPLSNDHRTETIYERIENRTNTNIRCNLAEITNALLNEDTVLNDDSFLNETVPNPMSMNTLKMKNIRTLILPTCVNYTQIQIAPYMMPI